MLYRPPFHVNNPMRFRLLTLLATLLFAAHAYALYDAKPREELAAMQGEWAGTLTYNDYSQPGKLVTLPTKLFVALSAPAELTLHYVYDDGPNKTVYSYEQMRFDFEKSELAWAAGAPKKPATTSRIVSNTMEAGVRRVVFERDAEKGKERYTLEVDAKGLTLKKEELDPAGSPQFRNKYAFRRVGL
jgi:hypothetical protein